MGFYGVVWWSYTETCFSHVGYSLDRLPTRTRIASWTPNTVTTCLLCDACEENRDHLFLKCRFSEQIWKMATVRLGYQPCLFHTWTSLIEWLRIKDSICPETLRKLTAQAVIYHIWLERNNRLNNAVNSTPQRIFKEIDRQVRNIILAREGRKKFVSLMCIWLKHS